MWRVETRLLSALLPFDRPYSYLSEARPEIGDIAALPFGSGNRYQYAVVTDFCESTPDHASLKKILFYLPSPFKIKKEGVSLAQFMSERCFCTFGECARVMLPSGLNISTEEYYVKGEKFELLRECEREFSSDVFTALSENESTLLKEAPQDALAFFIRHGFIKKETRALCRVNEKYETIARLSRAFSSLDVNSLLKGCKKRELYEKVIEYMSGAEDAVRVKTLNDVFSLDTAKLKFLEKKGIITLERVRVFRSVYESRDFCEDKKEIVLSEMQMKAYNTLSSLYDSKKPEAALLYGVTGSGKTSVILSLIDKAFSEGRGVIILVPEIALTLQNAAVLFSRYKNAVAVIHSAMSEGEREDAWENDPEHSWCKKEDTEPQSVPCAACGSWVLLDILGEPTCEPTKIYELNDELEFGKYKGKALIDVIHSDWGWVKWAICESDHFFCNIDEVEKERLKDVRILKSDDKLNFGKFKGKTIREVFIENPNYLAWLSQHSENFVIDFSDLQIEYY